MDGSGRREDGTWKKKKKKSFLQRAKKFGKSGRFGKGREIDKETYDYFVRVLEQMNRGFDSDDDGDDQEEQQMFVQNVFEQTVDQEAALSGNQLVSRVFERLLPLTNPDVQSRFMTSLADDLRRVATDPFASHVLELLLFMATFQSQKDEATIALRKTWVLRVAKFAVNNFDDFCFDTYASHLLRTCFQCLAGTKLDESLSRSRKSRDQKQNFSQLRVKDDSLEFLLGKSPVSCLHLDEWKDLEEILRLAVERVVDYESAEDLASTDTASGVVQALLLVLGEAKMRPECKKLCLHLIDSVFKNASLSENKEGESEEESQGRSQHILDLESGCRVLESMLVVSSNHFPKLFKKITSKLFDEKGKVLRFALHPVANFVLQKLLSHISEKELFEKWYGEELDDHLEDVLEAGNSGVVLSVAQACRRLNAKQSHFLVALMKSLHCYEPSQHQGKLAALLIHLSTKEAFEESESSSINLHGTLILQELLNFNKPIKLVSSLMEINPVTLAGILRDPRGCHVTDAFMNSKMLGEKSRDGLIKALQGQLVEMACSKHGSRSIDALWLKGSKKGREWMASELSAEDTALTSDQFGKFIAQKLFLSTFKRSREEWKQALDREVKKAEMAEDFLSGLNLKRPKTISDREATAAKRIKKAEEEPGFIIDTKGNLPVCKVEPLVEPKDGSESKPKKKKKKAKSYLDDL